MSGPNSKIRVAVLYGGRSAEHEVSLQTAINIIQNLDKTLFDVVPIGIDKKGNWYLGQEIFNYSLSQQQVMQHETISNTWFTPAWINQPTKEMHTQSHANSLAFDVIFPAVHGFSCEDGMLQGLLELAEIPYVGCGVLSSAIGMDKDISKRLVSNIGINVPPYLVVRDEQWLANSEKIAAEILQKLSLPLFVKPVNTGSSIGISKVKTAQDLLAAIELAFNYDTKIIIEKGLDARDIEVAVLENSHADAEPIVSVIGEVITKHEFYTYEAKYDDPNLKLVIPACIPGPLQQTIRDMAKKIFYHLECEGMARIDLFLDRQSQQIYFNEINTLPGFTPMSMYPKLMAASGITYTQLLTQLIQLALKRHAKRNKLNRNYLISETEFK